MIDPKLFDISDLYWFVQYVAWNERKLKKYKRNECHETALLRAIHALLVSEGDRLAFSIYEIRYFKKVSIGLKESVIRWWDEEVSDETEHEKFLREFSSVKGFAKLALGIEATDHFTYDQVIEMWEKRGEGGL